MTHQTYADSVLEQKQAIQAIYGDVDFSILPERYVSGMSIANKLPPPDRFSAVRRS